MRTMTARFMYYSSEPEPHGDLEASCVGAVRKAAICAWSTESGHCREDDRRGPRCRCRISGRGRVNRVVVLCPDVGVDNVEALAQHFDHQPVGHTHVSRETHVYTITRVAGIAVTFDRGQQAETALSINAAAKAAVLCAIGRAEIQVARADTRRVGSARLRHKNAAETEPFDKAVSNRV